MCDLLPGTSKWLTIAALALARRRWAGA